MDGRSPRLSVVVVSRNDDHGVNLQGRMQAFVNAFIGQCQRHDLHAELIFVEWNPPVDRPRLAEALDWPEDPHPCEVRIIEVPAAIHNEYHHAQGLPLYQMIGKNVGIRRARGEFVLCTNIDILFDDELVRFLKEGELTRGYFYGIDRTDVGPDVPAWGTVDEQLEYCRTHLLRIHTATGSYPLSPDGVPHLPLRARDVTTEGSGILLLEGWDHPEPDPQGRPFRWAKGVGRLGVKHPRGQRRRLLFEVFSGPGVAFGPLALRITNAAGELLTQGRLPRQGGTFALNLPFPREHNFELRLDVKGGGRRIPSDERILNFGIRNVCWDEEGSGQGPVFQLLSSATEEQSSKRIRRLLRGPKALIRSLGSRAINGVLQGLGLLGIGPYRYLARRRTFKAPELHTNACGDFTLMAREHWLELLGYAEFDMYSLHIDSLLLYAAHYASLQQIVLPASMHAYHIEHSAGSGWTPEGETQLFERLAHKGIPVLTVRELHEWARWLSQQEHRPLNRDDWGLAQTTLLETQIGVRGVTDRKVTQLRRGQSVVLGGVKD